MQTNAKIQARASHPPILLLPPQWEAIAAALAALRAAFQPALQPLSAAERRQLLGVNIANEAFTADYLALLQAHPGAVPTLLRPADTATARRPAWKRSWPRCARTSRGARRLSAAPAR